MVKMEMQHTKSQMFYKRKAEEAAVVSMEAPDSVVQLLYCNGILSGVGLVVG